MEEIAMEEQCVALVQLNYTCMCEYIREVQHSTAQHSTAQSTAQHSTAQHRAQHRAQHSTMDELMHLDSLLSALLDRTCDTYKCIANFIQTNAVHTSLCASEDVLDPTNQMRPCHAHII